MFRGSRRTSVMFAMQNPPLLLIEHCLRERLADEDGRGRVRDSLHSMPPRTLAMRQVAAVATRARRRAAGLRSILAA